MLDVTDTDSLKSNEAEDLDSTIHKMDLDHEFRMRELEAEIQQKRDTRKHENNAKIRNQLMFVLKLVVVLTLALVGVKDVLSLLPTLISGWFQASAVVSYVLLAAFV
jgi:uncharacterized protein YqhQ